MPGGDRTGPVGGGPMTGRAGGYCAGYTAPGFASGLYGRGYRGWGNRGGGRGHRNWFYATGLTGWQRASWWHPGFNVTGAYGEYTGIQGPESFSKEHQVNALKNQAKHLQSVIEDINSRVTELEGETKEQ